MGEGELPVGVRESFHRVVWKIASEVPAGKVATYGQIGEYIRCPLGVTEEEYKTYRARWVGAAMAACPDSVPWQRIINAQGKVSPRRGADMQRRLLEGEGVVFDARERIDLGRYAWSGPPAEWLEANGFLPPLSDLPLFGL